MHPYLFQITIAGHTLRPPTYGVFLALSFSAAYFLSIRRAVKRGDDPRHVENIFLLVVLSSVIGSRLFHVLFEEFSYYAAHPLKIFAVWEGGYTLYGAMLASILSLYLYTKRQKISYLHWGDIAAPSTAMGIAIGRVGCFLAGCCWGRATQCFLGVKFHHPETFANAKNIALHPAQLYEAAGALVIYFLLNHRWRSRKYEGQIFFEGLALYSTLRFLIEFFRGDEYRGFIFGGLISYSQLVSLAILPFAIAGMIVFSKKEKAKA